MLSIGKEMYGWAEQLFPICRSITGAGVRETLAFIKNILPQLEVKEVASGTRVFDWVVPDEWFINDAYITDEKGQVIVDFKAHNLHLVGYSTPVDAWMTLEELSPHLHSLPERPNAIPYVTSYYARTWGFCLTHKQRESLKAGRYRVVIDSELRPGVLNYGELIIPGEEAAEIFISTYVCHPSMANNELSGPVVATALARWIESKPNRRYTYRIIFVPETIGSIVYLSLHYQTLREKVIAGFNLTCVGDDRTFSFLPSRKENTLADKVAEYILKSEGVIYTKYNFLTRGSDERQYCWPGIDLPVVSVMRSKYATYPEYHTSDDDLSIITETGLEGAFSIHKNIFEILELNETYGPTTMGEPFLTKYHLYPTQSTLLPKVKSRKLIDFLAYCDGANDAITIGLIINSTSKELIDIINTLLDMSLIKKIS
jgi:aminopeptidase-like protein